MHPRAIHRAEIAIEIESNLPIGAPRHARIDRSRSGPFDQPQGQRAKLVPTELLCVHDIAQSAVGCPGIGIHKRIAEPMGIVDGGAVNMEIVDAGTTVTARFSKTPWPM